MYAQTSVTLCPGRMVAMTAKKTTRLLLLIAGVAVFVHAGRSIYLGLTTVETGQLARGIRWLPPTAEDISYYQSYSFTAAEFRIDRAALEAWCADKGWPLKPLEKPFMIDRYCWPLTYKLAATMPKVAQWNPLLSREAPFAGRLTFAGAEIWLSAECTALNSSIASATASRAS